MKYIFSIFLVVLLCNFLRASDMVIYLKPAMSTSQNTLFFKEYLNYGIYKVNNKNLKPEMNFTFDFKPALHVLVRYENFSFKYSTYIKNNLIPIESLQPVAYRYDGLGNISRYYSYDENRNIINTPYKVQYSLINYSYSASLTYQATKLIKIHLNYGNTFLEINKKPDLHKETFDSVTVYFKEKIKKYGFGATYQYRFKKFNISIQTVFYPLQEWTISFNQLERKINYNYPGNIAWNAGFNIGWKSFYITYKYVYNAAEKNKYLTDGHLIEFGFNWEIVRFDVDKLDLFY